MTSARGWQRPVVVDTRQADGTWVTETLKLSDVEYRGERPYDEVSVGHVVHPNGTLIDSLDQTFLGGAARLVLEMHPETALEMEVAL